MNFASHYLSTLSAKTHCYDVSVALCSCCCSSEPVVLSLHHFCTMWWLMVRSANEKRVGRADHSLQPVALSVEKTCNHSRAQEFITVRRWNTAAVFIPLHFASPRGCLQFSLCVCVCVTESANQYRSKTSFFSTLACDVVYIKRMISFW